MSYDRETEPTAELQWLEDSIELLAAVTLRSVKTIVLGVVELYVASKRRS